MNDVYLHIGPPKTGSTYLQNAVWKARHDLRQRGLLLPADHDQELFLAANDVQDGRFVPVDTPGTHGIWNKVVAQARSCPGTVLITHELFAFCEPDQIQRVASSLAPATLHLIVMARCRADVLPSLYQEKIKGVGADQSWEDFLADHRDSHESWPLAPGVLVQRWLAHIDRKRVHVITVPKRMADPHLLLHRFADVLGVHSAHLRPDEAKANTSLDAVDVALLRAVIARTTARLDRQAQQGLVNGHLAPLLRELDRHRRPLRLPESLHPLLKEAGTHDVAALTAADCHIHGNLDELLPDDEAFDNDWAAERPVSQADVLTAAIDALVAAARHLTGGPEQATASHLIRTSYPHQSTEC